MVQRRPGRSLVGELVDQRVNDEIASSYLDVWGKEKLIDPEVRAALAKVIGPARRPRKLTIEPGRCYQPEVLEQRRLWGLTVQLYGLRSERNWGIGDFTDLRKLIEIAAGLGAGVVGVNPLHATQGSPYSPSSRHALNVLYIDVEAVPGYEKSGKLRKRLQALRRSELVDYEGVRRVKLEALEAAFRKSKPRVKVSGNFPVFEALREKFGGGWQSWPKEYQDQRSPSVKAFSRKNSSRVAFHAWLQQIAREQLDAAQRYAQELGMPLGLYVDLALGADRGGAEVWSDQDSYAVGASCGAPPDEFNPLGQDWGLPPYSPRALRAKGYQPFIDLLRANMPVGGALRMDHVMALSRLWWIPQGAKPERGGYVNYPFRDLLAILAAESRRARCLVVGEDLGTVPGELRAALNEAGVLSYRPLLFEKNAQGEYSPPEAYPREALACVSTHDLPTWRGFWEAHDLHWRRKLGLTVDFEKELALRESDKQKLTRAGLGPDPVGAHAFIARTPAKLAMLQPEDVFELLEQANLPGTVDQHPNWRRKLPLALERWRAEPRVAALARIMAERSVAKGAPLAVPVHRGPELRVADPAAPPGGITIQAVSPPFRAEHIGSLLRPKRLLEDRSREDECIVEAIRWQESLGLKVVTDGEFRRESWRLGFVSKVVGFARADAVGNVDLQRDDAGNVMRVGSAPVAVTRIRRTGPIVADEVAFSIANTKCAVKATLPAPSYLHYPRGRNCVDRDVYPDLDRFFDDVVKVYVEELHALHAAGGRYLQIDEVAQTLLCDQRLRDAVRARGDDPERLIDLYIDLINRVARARPAGMTIGVHMCRGNAMGKWIAEGGYERIAEKAFNRLEVDAFFLEYDSERAGGFEPLRFMPKGKKVVLGLVSTKVPALESKDLLKKKIEAAARFVPMESLCLSPQCGFASHQKGTGLSFADQEKKLRLVVETAREAWQ